MCIGFADYCSSRKEGTLVGSPGLWSTGLYLYIYIYIHICVFYTQAYLGKYICIYIYICVFMGFITQDWFLHFHLWLGTCRRLGLLDEDSSNGWLNRHREHKTRGNPTGRCFCWVGRNPDTTSWYREYPICPWGFIDSRWLFGISSIKSILQHPGLVFGRSVYQEMKGWEVLGLWHSPQH